MLQGLLQPKDLMLLNWLIKIPILTLMFWQLMIITPISPKMVIARISCQTWAPSLRSPAPKILKTHPLLKLLFSCIPRNVLACWSCSLNILLEKKTSFLNSWSTLVNSDLLEECCVKIQIPGFFTDSLVKSPPKSCAFLDSDFKIPGSNINFVWGTLSIPSSYSHFSKHDSDEDSIASASGEELESSESAGNNERKS